ncbi:MAG: heavy metal-associated domain-containing protein [Rhodospirillaceae bacterium]
MVEKYRVGGMTCQGCARSVSGAIGRAIPAAKVAVEQASGIVTIDGPHDSAAVKAAVEGAGFEFLGAAA